MFRSKKTKKVVVSSLLGVMLLSTVAFAANGIFDKKITATHGRIKLSYQGEDITKSVEDKYGAPAFTVKEYDGRAYVPVRALADIMGVSVTYDSSTHTASFVDSEKLVLNKQLELKDQEIAALQAEINQLKNKVKEEEKKEESSKTDIKELEKKLNKDYGVVDDVSFDITLKETSSRITATITIDTKDYYESNAWRKMRVADKKSLMEDIAEDISKAFKNHKVEGSIYDNYQRYTLYTFTMNNNGKVTVSDRDYGYDYGYGDYRDVERELERDLKKLGTIESIRTYEGNSNRVDATIVFEDRGNSNEPDMYDVRDAIKEVERYLDVYIYAKVYYGNHLILNYN
ncbi:copper amine oxidase N-terminal domain-containing protein [Tissierella pigra]|uniref:stalk domain-containing protein n=1 Tax=Tissierella pigra TaxID=2607614 RepID=UPI001C129784|nr:stalk domain-containing protein [Tissierella pigra]MBU5427905.1 copper amine oxidase N-terminal domain-containing protein [Tissierella pigra]